MVLWGGLIILGNAVIANSTPETRVEGIPEGEDRALFGGNDDADNSGILTFVSIRHGGAELAPGDEINGLTLGAVGSGTTLEHIEVVANLDDGIEFFGGTVGLKYASVSYCGDDSFDWDLGYRGKGQFWFALVDENDGDNGGELDGAGGSDDNEPHSSPNVFNATFLGAGCNGSADNATAVYIRDGGGGKFQNSIFTDFIHGVEIEDKDGVDSRQRLEEGSLALENNIWGTFCNGDELADIIRPTSGAEDVQWLIDYLVGAGNTLTDPGVVISYGANGTLDPRGDDAAEVTMDNPATDVPADDDFYTSVCFKGAFLPASAGDQIWLEGWTALSEYGALNPALDFADPVDVLDCTVGVEEFEVVDNGYVLTQNVPNPFGYITEIAFTLPQKDMVTLTVFDMTGRQIARIIDAEERLAGTYKVEFDGSNLSNGLYYYNLTTQHVSLTKELVIVK